MVVIPIQNVKKVLDLVFSSEGYSIKDNIKLFFPRPFSLNCNASDNGELTLDFLGSQPKVTFKKYLTLSAWIEGIVLKENGGTIKIKYLPDIDFTYEEKSKTEDVFNMPHDFSDIYGEINFRYKDKERRLLAEKCLHYANEWATIACAGGLTKDDFRTKSILKQNCKSYVLEAIKNDRDLKYGSIILTIILLYVVLPVILRWILERIFSKLAE
jgi:hypothetical protein